MNAYQGQLSEVPTRCCFLDRKTGPCPNEPHWMLRPGSTGHCESHGDPRVVMTYGEWPDAFASGRAQVDDLRSVS
jgi:hypothetical protein